MNILITGCAGFIGFHLSKYILDNSKHQVFGIDNLNEYYDLKLKKDRLKILKKKSKKFNFQKIDITKYQILNNNFKKNKYHVIIHLAAQAGVRHSINKPKTYFQNNLLGFFNILDLAKQYNLKHFIYASTSSVYGKNINFPLKENSSTDKPLSFYAATKKSNEILAYSYSNIYKLPTTGLRFFTVYGPFGRPDMMLFKVVKSILENKKIDLYNYGNHVRDWTFIDDNVKSVFKLLHKPSKEKIPHQVINIGSGKPISLKLFISYVEKLLGKKAKFNLKPLQKGDVHKTHADINLLLKKTSFKPEKNTMEGIKEFIEWFKKYYK